MFPMARAGLNQATELSPQNQLHLSPFPFHLLPFT
jgi:hypothetical protein